MLILNRPWTRQPQRPVAINRSVWPGRSQTLLPSLGIKGILGEGENNFTSANANGDVFGNISTVGKALGFRPNTATSTGEVYTWDTGNFNVGADASMIAVLALTDTGLESYLTYGGAHWGLSLILGNTVAIAKYVDNPTTNEYTASITGQPSLTNDKYVSVGLTKTGNTIKVFFNGQMASASGGNGGIRRSDGTGFGSIALIRNFYPFGKCALASIGSVVIPDSAMFELLRNPWKIFQPSRLPIPTASAAASTYTLSAATYAPGSITATGVTPRVTVTVA